METVGFIIGNSLDGSVFSGDSVLDTSYLLVYFCLEQMDKLPQEEQTTSLYNLLLPGVPRVHKQQVVKKPVKKPVIIISYSRSEPSPCLTFTSCSALQGKSSRVCPNRPRASPLMAISRLFLE